MRCATLATCSMKRYDTVLNPFSVDGCDKSDGCYDRMLLWGVAAVVVQHGRNQLKE